MCSRFDLFQTGTTSAPSRGDELAGAELRFGLMGEAVADADGEFFEGEHEWRVGARMDSRLAADGERIFPPARRKSPARQLRGDDR